MKIAALIIGAIILLLLIFVAIALSSPEVGKETGTMIENENREWQTEN